MKGGPPHECRGEGGVLHMKGGPPHEWRGGGGGEEEWLYLLSAAS